MEYTIIRSKRKTIALSVDKSGNIIVRAGLRINEKFIREFVDKNIGWIEKQKTRIELINDSKIVLTESQVADMKKSAKAYMTGITQKWADVMRLEHNGVKITSATTRWGSCSPQNSICYSYRVMVLPEHCREYIAVHELAHIVHKNHSEKFYRLVEKYIPDYKEIVKQINTYHIA